MTQEPAEDGPASQAYRWVSRVIGVSVGLVTPLLIGRWLDLKLDTEPIGTLVGLTLGLLIAVVQLRQLIISSVRPSPSSSKTGSNARDEKRGT